MGRKCGEKGSFEPTRNRRKRVGTKIKQSNKTRRKAKE